MAKKKIQRSSNEDVEIKNRVRGHPEGERTDALNHEQERVRKWLKQVRFKKAFIGGVNEADVWKKIAELNTMYEAALSAERARYDALLQERTTLPFRQASKYMDVEKEYFNEHGKAGYDLHE